MERVKGIGGIFFKAKDKEALLAWYRDTLGVPVEPWGGHAFRWTGEGTTTWSAFEDGSDYFEPTNARFMINYRVDDLDAMLAQLREAGAQVDDKIEESEFGRFGWARDPEGNRFELWEPPEGM